ncbi:histidinol-phosphate transaminase [Paenibacillus sp. GCM10027626]|uniref:histidinol-phosphate transaminase n=1 Tax=Paenibacillus sp. GCM10027626 TaxID=3273411 RepID=UPI00362730C0
MTNYILPHIDALTTYALGEQPPEGTTALKLNQNESPYPPSPGVLNALRTFAEEQLRRYPDPGCVQLRQLIAQQLGIEWQQVFCGNGSSEIISLFFKVFVGPGGRVAIPDPTFSLYHTTAASFQASCIAVPTRDDFTIDVDALLAADAKAVVLVNPNAPTGLLLAAEEVERLVQSFDGLVLIDEAYIDFSPQHASALPLLQKYNNVIVLRTFSKAYALCGARVGYCAASRELIAALEKGRDIYNVNAISRSLALAALQDTAYLKWTVEQTVKNRSQFIRQLQQMNFDVLPSETNFVLCRPSGAMTAERIASELTRRNIFIRHFPHPRINEWLRISIGTGAELEQLLKTLAEITGQSPQ